MTSVSPTDKRFVKRTHRDLVNLVLVGMWPSWLDFPNFACTCTVTQCIISKMIVTRCSSFPCSCDDLFFWGFWDICRYILGRLRWWEERGLCWLKPGRCPRYYVWRGRGEDKNMVTTIMVVVVVVSRRRRRHTISWPHLKTRQSAQVPPVSAKGFFIFLGTTSQQSSKEEYEPWKWGATARYYASHTKTHVTNEEVPAKIQQAIGPHEDLLTIVKRRKLHWYGHVSRSSGLIKIILQGTVKGGRRQGRQRKWWEDNIREWTGLELGKSQRAVENRENWRKLVAKSSVVP